MFCSKCGKSVEDDAAFCKACGASLNQTPQSPPQPPPSYQQPPTQQPSYQPPTFQQPPYQQPPYQQPYQQSYRPSYKPQTAITMLKVVSILFIIGGSLSVILSIIALAALGSYGLMGSYGVAAVGAAALVLGLIGSGGELVIGILGLKKCADPSAAMFFIVTGFILCGINFLSLVMYFQVGSLLSFLLPVLYVVGGFMHKNARSA